MNYKCQRERICRKYEKLVKKNRLFKVLIIIYFMSATIIFLRPSQNINVLEYISINSEAQLSQFITWYADTIKYEAESNENVDFGVGQDVLKCEISHLKYGVYILEVEYLTSYHSAEGGSPICNLSFSGEIWVKSWLDSAYLHDYKSRNEMPFWIRSWAGVDNITLHCNFTGSGVCEIKSLNIREYQPWKIGFLLIEALVLFGGCFCYYKFQKAKWQKKLEWMLAALIIILASYPALIGNTQAYIGHDYEYHIRRIATIANELRYGKFPVMYQSDASNGFGYISHLLYGNIILYFPAILHLLGLPLTSSYNIFIILVNIITYVIAWYCSLKIFKEAKYAHFGAGLYLLAAYRLTNVYIRSAVGEYLAMAFLPLAFYGIYKIIYADYSVRFRDTFPLILGVTGIIECHILSTEMAALFISVIFVLHWKAVKRHFAILFKALLCVLGLNAFFLVPFIETYQADLMVNATATSANISGFGVYLPQLFNLFLSGINWAQWDSTRDTMSLSIGGPLIIGAILFLIVCIGKGAGTFSKDEKKSIGEQ